MGLDVTLLRTQSTSVYENGITHNLTTMADQAGIYKHLWRPEELEITTAGQLIEPLREGLAILTADPDHFRAFNAPNGFGVYEDFVAFVKSYLAACEQYPDATIEASR